MSSAILNCNAFMHKSANEGRCYKFVSGFSRERLKAGTKVEVIDTNLGQGGMTKVKLISWPEGSEKPKSWDKNDTGFIRTAKLELASQSIRDKLKLSNPSSNGLSGEHSNTEVSAVSKMKIEIEHSREFWRVLDDMLDLTIERETCIRRWRNTVRGLSTLQLLGGAVVFGFGISALILTGGAATPLIGALGYVLLTSSVSVVGVSSALAKGKLRNGAGYSTNTSAKRLAEQAAMKAATNAHKVYDAVSGGEVVSQGPFGLSEATVTGFSGGASTVGALNTMRSGYRGIRSGNRITPENAWRSVNWKEIVQALTNDYCRLQDAYNSAPGGDRESNEFEAFKASVLVQADQELQSLISKIISTIALSKTWTSSNISKTKLKPENGSGNEMASISYDNYISTPVLQNTSNNQALITLSEAQSRRYR